ncbi:reverse transcriptase domain-containing protein [Tanacetum coccineum]
MVQWTVDAEEAFQNIKEFIKTLPTLTAPIKGEALVMYHAASMESISAGLLAERGKRQIREHDIEFRGRNSVKGHILADFLAETTSPKDKETEAKKTTDEESESENMWKLYTDKASRSDGSRSGLMLVSNEVKEYTYALRFEFETTNNEAEYEALLVGLVQAKSIIQEIHQGSCGMHAGPRLVVSKIIRVGYYWPLMYNDTKALIQRYEACHIHSSIPKKLKQEMAPITSAWPFSQWRIDIMGPLPMAPRGARLLVVAINYKPLVSTTEKHVEKFIWEHIVCRFGIPQIIISDNVKQFAEGIFPAFY